MVAMETTAVMKTSVLIFGEYSRCLRVQSLIMMRQRKKMLSGFEIFNFFVSDHLNVML